MSGFPVFQFLQFDLSLERALWISALALAVIFVVYSAFLLYHWLRYGAHKPAIVSCMFLYFGVSAFLFTALVSSLIILT